MYILRVVWNVSLIWPSYTEDAFALQSVRLFSSGLKLNTISCILFKSVVYLGVIHGVRVVPVLLLLEWRTEGYRTPTFQDEKVRNLLSPAVNRGDLRRLNYNKTIFGRRSAPDPTGRVHGALSDPRVRWWGDTSSPFSSPLASLPKGVSFSFWTGTPLFRPKLRPC